MISTYLSTALILPGLYMEDGRPPEISELEFWDQSQSGGFAFIDNESKAIYSLTRQKIVTLEEIQVDDKNRLSETLIIARSIEGIEADCDFHNSSCINWLADGEYYDMLFDGANFEGEDGIAGIVKRNYDYELAQANKNLERYKHWLEDKIFQCSFIALWTTHTSQGYEDLYPELDCIEFLGEGTVILAEKTKYKEEKL